LSALLAKLTSRVVAYPLVAIVLSFIVGIILWGGFNTALEATNTETFCISCHEMKDNVYPEYRQSSHYQNRSGVRAGCPDCHVPKDWPHMLARKIGASNELFHKFIGSIDTREKFLNERMALAEEVWRTMEKTDSRECRNCHSFEAMQTSLQRNVSQQQHLLARAKGQTCIDCHKGIAHQLPEAFLEREHARYKREKVPCYQCHADMQRPPDDDWDE